MAKLSRLMPAILTFIFLLITILFLLIGYSPVYKDEKFDIDWDLVRQMAGTEGLPKTIHTELVGRNQVPGFFIEAGFHFGMRPMCRVAYQVDFGGKRAVIDTGMNDQQMEQMHLASGEYFEAAENRVIKALSQAEWVMVTHEHGDHMGGLMLMDHVKERAKHILLTKQQMENQSALSDIDFPEDLLKVLKPVNIDRYAQIAPGIVMVKAPGHTPGSVMYFVRLENGKEVLLAGDIAFNMDNIRDLVGRPKLVSDFFLGEDRTAVAGQLLFLNKLLLESDVVPVAAHDCDQLEALLADKTFIEGFRVDGSKKPN